MTGASIVPTSGQSTSGSSLPFERELLFKNLPDAGSTVLNRPPLPWWDEVVADRCEYDVVETVWFSTITTCTCLGPVLSVILVATVPPIEDIIEVSELSLDSLLIDPRSGRLLLGDLTVVVERLLVLRRRWCGPLDALVSWSRHRFVRCCGLDISITMLYLFILARRDWIVRGVGQVVSLCRFGGCCSDVERIEWCLDRLVVGSGSLIYRS